jgi:hypothetical protein
MHFRTKNYLKSTRNHTVKHALSVVFGNNVADCYFDKI